MRSYGSKWRNQFGGCKAPRAPLWLDIAADDDFFWCNRFGNSAGSSEKVHIANDGGGRTARSVGKVRAIRNHGRSKPASDVHARGDSEPDALTADHLKIWTIFD